MAGQVKAEVKVKVKVKVKKVKRRKKNLEHKNLINQTETIKWQNNQN